MFMTPVAVLFNWFRGILSLAIIAGGVWLIAAWFNRLPKTEVVQMHENVPLHEEKPEPNADRDVTIITRRLGPFERVRAWRPAFDYETALLLGGVGLLLWSVGGCVLSPTRLLAGKTTPVPELPPGQVQRVKQLDGTELHVEIRGSANAPTVILTHGWSLSSQEWVYLVGQWGDQFRTVVWDLPGLGKSTQPDNRDFSLERLARDLRAVIEATSSGPVILVGHSIGGMIILTFCKMFPELLGTRIAKLVLIHTTYINPLRTMIFHGLFTALQKPLVEPLLYLQIAMSPLVRCMNFLSYLNGSVHRTVARHGFCGHESRSSLDFLARYSIQDSPAVLARGSLGMLEYDASQTLPTIKIPVLVIGGDKDPVTMASASEKMHRDIPQSHLLILRAAKHYGLIEYNAEVANVTSSFCS